MIRSAGLVSVVVLLACSPQTVDAHPMGNFSINHYSKLKIGQKSVNILYLIDLAEIPTYQEIRQSGLVPKRGDPGIPAYLSQQEKILKQGLSLASDQHAIPLETISRDVTFSDGAGGLPTMKLAFMFQGKLPVTAGTHKLTYSDNNFPGRTGWKEIVVAGDGAEIIGSSAPKTDRSGELSTYSTDLLDSPPQQLSALVEFRNAVPPVPLQTRVTPHQPAATVSAIPAPEAQPALPNRTIAAAAVTSPVRPKATGGNTPRSRFTDLIATQGNVSIWFLVSAAFLAAGLGAMHALEPGHGKTLVAAYLVGSRGTAKHAVLLGIVVTAAHTAGVFALGLATLYASRYIVPERLYPWLGAISGISVAALGAFMFLKHLTGESGDHSHAPGEPHSHWFTSLFQRSARPPSELAGASAASSTVSFRELCTLGITGGIIPCPAALVVLLSAFSLHRIGFGLFLITAFSVGLASVLVTVGLAMVYTKRFASTYFAGKENSWVRYLPLLSSALMVVLGIGIAIPAFGSLPSAFFTVSKGALLPIISVTLLGLFLGMRHSTDSDHIVAVSTLVSRQGSIRSSATIGMLWGLGHTLTIFLVGSAIIIFGVVIPPRLGLSMEFSVALMLILLGLLNLSGVLKRITERFSPAPAEVTNDFPESRQPGRLGLFHTVRPLFIGLVHGLAGSAAVALLVLSTIRNPFWATAYLLVFGFGTMLGMVLMTAAISLPLVYAKNRFTKLTAHLTMISGIVSVAFGVFLVFQIGFVDGLFTSQAHWIPR